MKKFKKNRTIIIPEVVKDLRDGMRVLVYQVEWQVYKAAIDPRNRSQIPEIRITLDELSSWESSIGLNRPSEGRPALRDRPGDLKKTPSHLISFTSSIQ